MISNFVGGPVLSKMANATRRIQTLRERLVNDIVRSLHNGVTDRVVQRAFEYWCNAERDLSERVERAFAPDRHEKMT
jgi:hypothetical protein